ncbi:FxsB family cyclophane-forming radical SAM/SPASM peptide maturase [Actinocrispum wychmicini]|uniref:FxsB family cyclophane-forming radical SAM/SPASM peptide maturase n=1 Tax=Actinocrispum wychmicini TaxID=1213861 RepID=UPI001FB636A2|nr:FxsB family cyclophane-forming radical SAM/SPASM peptide maturase [Actinocrispum wychmicini]
MIKLHGRCNLACDYCYVYEMADQRWRARPRSMAPDVIDRTVARIAEHVSVHSLEKVDIVIHGGEPLLAGPAAVRRLVTSARTQVDASVRVSLQTNGVLLDRTFLELLGELDVRVSVSVDGGQVAHDRHRVTADGRGSYQSVAAALRQLGGPEFRSLYAGLLCVVDLANDPVETYAALLAFDPPAIDLLLPHGNWSAPPPGRVPDAPATPYADWLIAVFDHWVARPRRETRIRLFEEIIHVLLGGRSHVEGVGLAPTQVVVVETDGTIEQSDILASAFDGAADTGLHVARDSFDAVLDLPDMVAQQAGLAALGPVCQGCDLREVCGGGLRAHRFDPANGFANPSVYCLDLDRLIRHIRATVAARLAVAR